MRLIDADALTETIGIRLYSGAVMEFVSVEDIAKQPTVDAVPVRHGKWIDRNGAIVAPFWERYECSECGARSDNSNYCPNCGARMVEDE